MIGILSAMPQEAGLLARELKREAEHVHGGRTYCTGTLAGRRVVVVFSRIGKVAAAATAQHLIDVHRVQSIVFSGVAGALDPTLSVGDIIVGRRLWQHDMDASPIFPALEVPLLGVSAFAADARISAALEAAAHEFLKHDLPVVVPGEAARSLGIRHPRVHAGDIASGDRFVSSGPARDAVRSLVPSALCVEMEGAAVAQVCHEQGIPFGVVRTISDTADDSAPIDFARFIESAASHYGLGILNRYLAARD
ncbi:MAG: 5'-methylthioadenosine/adenosylhomocysteine nucleosidase [Phycisphaerales bacterium]|nr:5'-methylthioadenosine/adenosylhomocysteine nucleosidase [Planctomycetota bacterium]